MKKYYKLIIFLIILILASLTINNFLHKQFYGVPKTEFIVIEHTDEEIIQNLKNSNELIILNIYDVSISPFTEKFMYFGVNKNRLANKNVNILVECNNSISPANSSKVYFEYDLMENISSEHVKVFKSRIFYNDSVSTLFACYVSLLENNVSVGEKIFYLDVD